jgi:hypothetical protein
MKRRGVRLAALALVLVSPGCDGPTSSSPSTRATPDSPPASGSTTTVLSSTSTTITSATTVAPTSTNATATTESPTTTEVPASTEPPDTGSVDIMGWVFNRSGLSVTYIVMNNTNHGIANPQVHVDFVDANHNVILFLDQTTEATIAPGDFVQDTAHPPSNNPIAFVDIITGGDVTLTGATKVKAARSPVTVEDLRAEPVADALYGGTVLLGTLVNGTDAEVDIAEVHALLLDEFGRADLEPQYLDPTWLVRMEPGDELPFLLRTLEKGVTPDRVRIALVSAPTRPPRDAQIRLSPITVFLAPSTFGVGEVTDNLEVIGELTNTGDKPFAVHPHSVMCVLRDPSGAIVDLALASGNSYPGQGYYSVDLQTDVEPGVTAPFSCGYFFAAAAIPGFATDLGSYTVEIIAQPGAFVDPTPPLDRFLTPSQISTVFDGSRVAVGITFTNTRPEPRTANAQARAYDIASGRLLSFTTLQFQEVVAGNGVYNIPPGVTRLMTVPVDLPAGIPPDSVRFEADVELLPEFTG